MSFWSEVLVRVIFGKESLYRSSLETKPLMKRKIFKGILLQVIFADDLAGVLWREFVLTGKPVRSLLWEEDNFFDFVEEKTFDLLFKIEQFFSPKIPIERAVKRRENL